MKNQHNRLKPHEWPAIGSIFLVGISAGCLGTGYEGYFLQSITWGQNQITGVEAKRDGIILLAIGLGLAALACLGFLYSIPKIRKDAIERSRQDGKTKFNWSLFPTKRK